MGLKKFRKNKEECDNYINYDVLFSKLMVEKEKAEICNRLFITATQKGNMNMEWPPEPSEK